jgi:hypothetical protein
VRRSALSAVAGLALLGPAGAIAATGATPSGGLRGSPLLWTTIDVCQSSASGDVVGLRGSMPGSGNANEQMYMIFRLQYRATKHKWSFLPGTDSGLVDAGSAEFRVRQAGLDYRLAPSPGSKRVLRGRVTVQWRLGATVVHSARMTTTAGHSASAGANPPGFSVADCAIS